MYHTCVNSTISLRCKGSLYFSLNDYSRFLNDGFDANPMPSPLSFCHCCSNSIHDLPINPSFLYGLKQSTLIQWSASRRLILCGGDRYRYRVPIPDVNRNFCCGNSWSLKERSVSDRRGRWRNGRFGCMISEERSKGHHLRNADDVEVMLSLLTEEVNEECFGVKERKNSSARRAQAEKRANGGGASYRGKKKDVGSKSNLKKEFESVAIQSKVEGYRQKEDIQKEVEENVSTCEKCRARREGSSRSSYYSLSSMGDFEIDNEVRVKSDGIVGESSGEHHRVAGASRGATFNEELVEEVNRHGDVVEGRKAVLRQENTAVGSATTLNNFVSDWRKKSEKKLSDGSTEHTQPRNVLPQHPSKMLEAHESSYCKASGCHNQYGDREKKSTLSVKIDDGAKQPHSQTSHQVAEESKSRMRYKQFSEEELPGGNFEMTSSSRNQFSGREADLDVDVAVRLVQERGDEPCKTASHITGHDAHQRKSQQHAEASEIQEIDIIRGTSTSQRLSETRVDNWESNSTVVQSSVQKTESQHHKEGQWDSRKQLNEMSDSHFIFEKTSALQKQSDTRLKKQEDHSNLVSGSHSEGKKQHFQAGQKSIRRLEAARESRDVTNISAVHSHDGKRISEASETRTSSQEIYSTSTVETALETLERCTLTDERESRNEAQTPAKAPSFSDGMSREASSYQASVQEIGVHEVKQRNSQSLLVAPPSQLVERSSPNVVLPSGHATQEVSNESLESDYYASRTHSQVNSPTSQHEIRGGARRGETYQTSLNVFSHEDALDSAARLQKSSAHFVDEFVEKVRHEVSTSEIQMEKKTSEMILVCKGEESQYGSGDFQSTLQESGRSSHGFGAKGPTDEMWDVKDPSNQQSPPTEVPEGITTTGNAITKRTGRSLWNIIADIVRLRWASHSETRNSVVKPGGRSLSNQSTSSDTWFSGDEPDESNDENVKKEKRSKPQEAAPADQQQVRKSPTQNLEKSSSIEKIRHARTETPSSSSVIESGSASKSISSVSWEETIGLKDDQKKFQGTFVDTASVPTEESSFLLHARHLRRSPIVEISEAGKTSGSGSGLVKPTSSGLLKVSASEGKDSELKQRKFQRTNQFGKDRFDEWEDAYKLESEQRKIDEMFMREALLEGKKAADSWEVPVGAVLVQNGKIIARGFNLVEELRDSTAHAEMICIREASNLLRTWRLSDTTLYVTLEPCPMCAGAILQARIDTLVWGAHNKLLGADGSWIRLFPNGDGGGLDLTDKSPPPVHPFHPKMTIRRGVLASECADNMQQFFQLRRKKKEKKADPPSPPSCLTIASRPSKLLTKMHDFFHLMFCL